MWYIYRLWVTMVLDWKWITGCNLTGRKQFVTISGQNSKTKEVKFAIPQGSILGPLLFLMHIIEIQRAFVYSDVFVFADDTSLLYSNDKPKAIKKQLNIDLKLLLRWLKSNKIALNVAKTEIILFKHNCKVIEYDLKIKLGGQTEEFARKLRSSNGVLCRIRHLFPRNILRSLYFALFESHLRYAIQIWR